MNFLDFNFRDPIEFEDAVLVPAGFRASTPAWRALVKADYGSPLTPDEMALYLEMSGGVPPCEGGSTRILNILGRRSGKSETVARCIFFEINCVAHYKYLAPGQVGIFAIIAQERDISCEVFRYLAGFNEFSIFKPYIKKIHDTANDRRIVFANGIEARVITASKKSVRGPTYVGGCLDEIAFWDHDGESRDADIIDAFTPGFSRSTHMPPRRLWAISSANVKRGWAWDTFDRSYGKSGTVWTARTASSLFVRPDLDEKEIIADCDGRPGKREREYECVWGSTDASAFFGETLITACTDKTRSSAALPPRVEGVTYRVGIDAAFVHDEFSIAVACSQLVIPPGAPLTPERQHRERRTEIAYTEGLKPSPKKPLNPLECVARVVEICRHFGTTTVYADQHEAASLRESFKQCGIKMVLVPWTHGTSEGSKSNRFLAVRDAMLASKLTLPDDPELVASLGVVMGEPTSSGETRIVKSKGDDRACAAVLAASEALSARASIPAASLTPWERSARLTYGERFSNKLLSGGSWIGC